MTVTDLVRRIGTETPVETTPATKPVVEALEQVKPTAAGTFEQRSIEKFIPQDLPQYVKFVPQHHLVDYVKAPVMGPEQRWTQELTPYRRYESTERAILLSYQPIAAATSPLHMLQGEVKNSAHASWLTIALKEPLATATPTSFEAPFRYPALAASPVLDLVRHYLAQPDVGAKLALQHGRGPVVEHEPELVRELGPNVRKTRAYRTFVELADWLGLTQAQTAELLGMGRTTPLAWEREGHEPQPARARRLYQTHALVSTLVRRLGREDTRRWLEAGDPSPLALIGKGDVTRADDLADELIFGTYPSPERLGGWAEEGTDTDPPAANLKEAPPRRVRRRAPRRRTR
jgi:hypothetical protein